jgi:hypothetical protein
MEDEMKKLMVVAAIAAGGLGVPAAAHDTETAFPTRGACEAASAGMSNDERNWLLETFPDIFATGGEVSSFLTRAWTCDRNGSDGQFYIVDHRGQVLSSDWFNHRSK